MRPMVPMRPTRPSPPTRALPPDVAPLAPPRRGRRLLVGATAAAAVGWGGLGTLVAGGLVGGLAVPALAALCLAAAVAGCLRIRRQAREAAPPAEIRDGAWRAAYRLVGAVWLVSLVYGAAAAPLALPLPTGGALFGVLLVQTLVLVTTAPAALLLWTLPARSIPPSFPES